MTAFKTKTGRLLSSVIATARSSVQDFAREEDGILAKPMIITTLLMLTVGGIGIDLMRFERDRTMLQYTLDRAVLAAADLDQTLEPEVVVQDYLEKSGLGDYYQTPWHDSGLGYKKVDGSIQTPFAAQYLRLVGDPELTLTARSRAEESIDDIEISLVLDVSGSMGSNQRLVNLKVAAKEFIDTMSTNTTDGKMSMSIIPYATQVSVPDEVFAQLNVSSEHSYSNCINFEASDFATPQISTTTPYERTMHFSPWYAQDRRTNSSRLVSLPVCDDRAAREMLVMQKDPETLKNFIDGFVAEGNTSIDLGMKWGSALLDRSFQPVVSALSSGDTPYIDPAFSARPAEYSDGETMKIIVLMTDGQNTSQYYLRDQFRDGPSDVWYNATANRYSTYASQYNEYYWDGYGNWEDHPYGNGTYTSCGRYSCSEQSESGTAVQLSYPDLWADSSMRYVSDYLFGDWMGRNSARSKYYYGAYNYYGTSTKNARTQSICDAAKAEGIIVFTIGFEAPSSGQAVLKNCASSDAHYFDVDGLEISDAFASIATSIRQLRLTQ